MIKYARISVWHVELASGFTVNLVWLKDNDPDFTEVFGNDYISAVQIGNDGLINPMYLMYVDSEVRCG